MTKAAEVPVTPSSAGESSARAPKRMELIAIGGIPLVRPGDNVATLIKQAMSASAITLQHGDVFVIAQKIVSKAEGRYVALAGIEPSPRANELAALTAKDARLVEIILRESRGVVRWRKDVLIVEHRLGYVLANAGVDASNVGDEGRVLLLPEDPDASAAAIRAGLERAIDENSDENSDANSDVEGNVNVGARIGVVINDSWGRAWRLGTIGTALGVSGIPAVADLRGTPDLFGRKLQATEVAVADELAAAASLMMGQAAEGHPVVLARGFPYARTEGRGAHLVRPKSLDLFR
ncbi:MAG: coenzyme F420-0:L-glutamate ligase [Betaproteobacteria bacterium]|nr:coenzyme F420-0:L-glutamate ligase [Betaproteobacteria bacterium]